MVVSKHGFLLESPRELLKFQMPRLHPRPIISESLGMLSEHRGLLSSTGDCNGQLTLRLSSLDDKLIEEDSLLPIHSHALHQLSTMSCTGKMLST